MALPNAVRALINRGGDFSLAQTRKLRSVLTDIYDTLNSTASALSATVSSNTAAIAALGSSFTTEGGSGVTGWVDTYGTSISVAGDITYSRIMIDITNLHSRATDGHIIGGQDETNPCHIGYISFAEHGITSMARMTCIETPAGGDPNIDLYAAVEGTGAENTAISALTETRILDAAGDWAAGDMKEITPPAANRYLYLTQGDATGTNADYSAGKFLLEFWTVV